MEGFHEVIDDINEKFHYLDDSNVHVEKIFVETIKNKKFRLEIDSEVSSMIDVANDIKLIIESILLPHSTSIPCLTDLRRKLICLVYTSNGIRRRAMEWYKGIVVDRLKSFWREVTTSKIINVHNDLSIEMFLSMMNVLSIEVVVYEENFELIATMQKVVKERHEEIIKIEKRMKELEQVLFQMYVMVQEKLVVLVNEQGNGDGGQKKIYGSVENLVREAYLNRENASIRQTIVRMGLIVMLLGTFMFGTMNLMFCSGLGWFKGGITGFCSEQDRFIDWVFFEFAYILMCVSVMRVVKDAKAEYDDAEKGLLD